MCGKDDEHVEMFGLWLFAWLLDRVDSGTGYLNSIAVILSLFHLKSLLIHEFKLCLVVGLRLECFWVY